MTFAEYEAKCRMVQAWMYENRQKGQKPNSFSPFAEPGRTVLETGEVCLNDIAYGTEYPNSYFDLWYPDDKNEKRPTFVYIHGGGFLFGDKTSGDPLAAGTSGNEKLISIVRAGFNLVNVNYALAPDYRFPVQVKQIDELMRYLILHAEELHLDMRHVALSGGSAGADITEIYGACVVNPEYAAALGIQPVMTEDTLRVLAIDEAALDSRTFFDTENMMAMLMTWIGDVGTAYEGTHLLLNAKEHIRDHFIPSWINTSNQEKYFVCEALDLAEKLKQIGCAHDLVYFPADQAALPHGYVDEMASNPLAREAFDRMIAFVREHISVK